ncbi:hypothetical protein ACLQ3C_12865 [Gordonia sp. DT30]|uniref:hypothetical protein n=1 Tax=Gordonia sp. DT30 TaxID=3416546 RepID=UPI003CEAA1C9
MALRRVSFAVIPAVATLLTLSACSSDNSDSGSGEPSLPSQSYSAPDSNTARGTQDEPIPSQIPEGLHVGEIAPIGAEEMVMQSGSFGQLEVPVEVYDPATGKKTAHIVVGQGIWDPVIHAFVGKTPHDPAVLAAEVWRPRGSRGAAQFTVSTYSGNLLTPKEVALPSVARAHSRTGSHAVTSDGRYFVTWDDALFGIRVVDLHSGKQSGTLKLPACGPFTWLVGHDLYSVCEQDRKLLQVHIGDDGVPKEVGRQKVLPADFVSARESTFAADAKKALLVGANGDVYVFDFSHGLPTTEVRPIGNAGDPSGRFDTSAISRDGSRIAISYTDTPIHPQSVRGGDVTKVVLFDAANLHPIKTITLDQAGLKSFGGFAFNENGKKLYLLGGGPEADGETPQKLVGFSSTDGAQTSSVTLDGKPDKLKGLFAPEIIG